MPDGGDRQLDREGAFPFFRETRKGRASLGGYPAKAWLRAWRLMPGRQKSVKHWPPSRAIEQEVKRFCRRPLATPVSRGHRTWSGPAVPGFFRMTTLRLAGDRHLLGSLREGRCRPSGDFLIGRPTAEWKGPSLAVRGSVNCSPVQPALDGDVITVRERECPFRGSARATRTSTSRARL